MDKPLLSVTHGHCDARLTVTFQAQVGTHRAYPQRDGLAELTWLHTEMVYPSVCGHPSRH